MVDTLSLMDNSKQVEHDMYNAIPNFNDFNDNYSYEDWKGHFETFFRYFSVAFEKKDFYARLELARF